LILDKLYNGITGGDAVMKVYIVEDSPMMVDRIQSKIADIEGLEIAGSAAEEVTALNDIRELNPDFMIIDIRLKAGDGINLLKKIKKERPGVGVAMLTNYSSPEFREKCMSLGADFFFDKSRDFDRISETLAMWKR